MAADGSFRVGLSTLNWRPFAAGSVAGVGNVLVGHPLDTLKVRLQVARQSGPSAPRALAARSLYSGVLAPLATTPWLSAVNFGIYDAARVKLTETWPQCFASHNFSDSYTCEDASTLLSIFAAGTFSGLSYSLARALPLAAVTLTSYDFVLRHLSG
eukprot:TRINITY_DN7164_c0_g1_i4.p1 TRINITY_DN7164_c0_g1~~TRINITY_DN7164_c0_g1_i4.p1  ORF type:complete len:156 (-),score=15.71 TRINITY_DN7164_c0_g1_i4:131-598(-)